MQHAATRTYDRLDHAGRDSRPRGRRALARAAARDVGFDNTGERLEDAYDLETKTLALTIDERKQIICVLDDLPSGLAELRGVLVREHEWRVRDGLV